MSTTTLPIFVTGVSFPAKKPGDMERAWLELHDDADGHELRIAVDVDFAREVSKHFPTEDGDGSDAQITIRFPFDGDAVEEERPTKKLPAILEATISPPATYDAHAQKLVLHRRAYEAKLKTTPPGPEHDVQQGIVDGLQIAIDLRSSTSAQIAVLAGYSVTSGGFGQALAGLRALGLIEGGAVGMSATMEGIERVGVVDPMPRGDALVALWRGKLDTAAGNALDAVVDLAKVSPNPITNQQIADQTGYSLTSGGFGQALATLRAMKLIEKRTNRPIAELLR